MRTTLSGTLVDPIQKSSLGARLTISDAGTIEAITPDDNPGPLYILPGFVDAHVHIESSMLTPAEFARAAVVHGTLAAVADPHEIANVLGEEGVELMLELARQTPFVFGFGAPSCVPATPFESAGARLDPAAVARLLARPGVTHLAEMMNVAGVLNRDAEVVAKLAAARAAGKPIDGHCPGLTGAALQAYAAEGITTDHESLSFDEAREKIKAGIKLQIRYGSAARPFESFIPLLARYPDMCMFCSNDKHPDNLLQDHINHLAATAYRKGISLQAILQAACVNPVQHYRLPLGLLQPGDTADFMLLDDFDTFTPREVWLRGQCVARDGQPLLPHGEPCVRNRFAAELIRPDALRVPAPAGRALRVIGVRDGQLVTESVLERPAVRDGFAVPDTGRDLIKLVVCNRYAAAPPALAFVKGFGLTRGAIASSVAHDSHHIVAAGATDEALAAAINEVVMRRGGLAVADNNRKILMSLPLPLAGLISAEPAEIVARAYSDCNALAKILGAKLAAPFMTLSFLSQSVIPHLKLTDKGLFDCDALQHVPLFVED
jgi:adenine deaminase